MLRRIPYLSVSKNELALMIKQAEKQGKEGKILFLSDNSGPIARKIFGYADENNNYLEQKIETIKLNKEKKIIEIYNIENFKNEIKPIRMIYCNDNFVGYDMTRNNNATNLCECSLTKDEKISCFEKIEDKLKYFHDVGIVFGDVRGTNILYSKKTQEVSFCDLDNAQVQNFPIDLYLNLLSRYNSKDKLIDKKWDAFMFNLLLLQEFDNRYVEYSEILTLLEMGYRPSCINRYGRLVLQGMVEAEYINYYDGKYLTPYIKKKR